MAQSYRKIDPRLWTDEVFEKLTMTNKVVALYLLSSRQVNRIGIYRLSPAMGAEQLGISLAEFLKALETVCAQLNWQYDQESRVLYIPTWWKYNNPGSAKTLKGYLRDTHDLPDTTLLSAFYCNLKYLPGELGNLMREIGMGIGIPIPMPKGMASPELELEPEPEPEQEEKSGSAPQGGKAAETHPSPAAFSPANPDDDPLESQVRHFLNSHPLLLWNRQDHSDLKKLVAAKGWDFARKFIQKGIEVNAPPIAYAVGAWKRELKEARAGPTQESRRASARTVQINGEV